MFFDQSNEIAGVYRRARICKVEFAEMKFSGWQW